MDAKWIRRTLPSAVLLVAACSTQRAPDAPLASTQDPTLHQTTSSTSTGVAPGTHGQDRSSTKTAAARAHNEADDAAKHTATQSSTTTTVDRTSTPAATLSTPAATVDRANSTASTGGGPTATDNTGVNTRDRNDSTLTPMDQGGSEADRTTTQKIRQAVVGDKALSFNAKNTKIITINGKVTLRGPVKSEAERASIEAKARAAGATQVDNQLEIKP